MLIRKNTFKQNPSRPLIHWTVLLFLAGIIHFQCVSIAPVLAQQTQFRPEFSKAFGSEASILESQRKRWIKQKNDRTKPKEKIQADMASHGEFLLEHINKEEYKDLTDAEIKLLQEMMIVRWLSLIQDQIPTKQWNELYEKYRAGEKGMYKGSKNQAAEWGILDKLYKVQATKPDKNPGQARVIQECPEKEKSILDVAGQYTFELVGDGSRTSEVLLIATNKETGAVGATILDTVCASRKLDHPPPTRMDGKQRGLTYVPGKAPLQDIAIIKAANQAMSEGKFKNVPLPDPENAVTQGALWKAKGEATPDPKDDYTKEVGKADLTKKVENKLGRPLTPAENDTVEQANNSLFDGIDYSGKLAEGMMPKLAEKPKDADGKQPKKDEDKTPPQDANVQSNKDVDSGPPTSTKDPKTTQGPETLKDPNKPDATPDTNPPDSATGPLGDPSTHTFEPGEKFCIPPFTKFDPIDPNAQALKDPNATPPGDQSMETVTKGIIFIPVNPDLPYISLIEFEEGESGRRLVVTFSSGLRQEATNVVFGEDGTARGYVGNIAVFLGPLDPKLPTGSVFYQADYAGSPTSEQVAEELKRRAGIMNPLLAPPDVKPPTTIVRTFPGHSVVTTFPDGTNKIKTLGDVEHGDKDSPL